MNDLLANYWDNNEDEGTYFLRVKGLLIAVIQPSDTEGKYCIYAYDSDWQDLYLQSFGTDMPEFDSIEIAKSEAERLFIKWVLALKSLNIQ